MTDYSYSIYLVPSIWNNKNGDRIYGATVIRNEYNQNLKNISNSSIIKFHGKKSYFVHNNINTHNTWQNKNILHVNLSHGYENFELKKFLRLRQKLFKDVDENIVNKKKMYRIPKLNSVPDLICYNHHEITVNPCSQSSDQIPPKSIFKSGFVNNVISDYSNIKRSYHCSYPFQRACCWKVYRCQFNTQEESCCCSCNSDAMFDVMKSLYDCYKKKNCDNCNCILCGHLPREERRLGKLKKSGVSSATVAVGEKHRGAIVSEKALKAKVRASIPPEAQVRVPPEKLSKAEAVGLLTPLKGKDLDQEEKILRGLAMQGIPFPEAKTASEKKLIDKVRADVGLPPEPKTPSAKKKYNRAIAAGLITPLEGKSAARKEDILRRQAKMGLPLPEGRTNSEKALIAKIGATAPLDVGVRVPSEKLRIAKATGLLTPLEDKKPENKEKILRGLAMQGIPLPEAKTASEKKLIDKVRADVGLPPEPKTSSVKEKYNRALAAGLITPLEGKSAARKEDILRGQTKMGLPLPEGRTPSEKALIAKVRATAPSTAEIRVPSEKLRKAKATGFLTPLKGKSLDQKEKILRGLAMQGIPLPEAKTASEKKLIDKVRGDVGLPPEPKTSSVKEKYNRAFAAGLVTPLEGKSAARKEDILRGQAKMGLPLPEGRTSSEKALIAKVKATSPLEPKFLPTEKPVVTGRPALAPKKLKKLDKRTAKIIKEIKGPSDECICDLLTPETDREIVGILVSKPPLKSIIPADKIPSGKLRKAKAEGLLTSLEGKKPEEKERILKELALEGIPLPEAKSASEKKIIDKVRTEVGLPPVPKEPVAKKKFDKALADGIITPLEGKSAARKKEILRSQAKRGLILPQGRTPSEKAIIAKLKATVSPEKEIISKTDYGQPIKAKTPSEKRVAKRRTPSEKALISEVRATAPPEAKVLVPSEKLRKVKAAGLLTPLEDKKPEHKEKILRGLAMQGIPLPEAKTASDKKLINKVRADVGLPPEPKTSSVKEKYNRALAAGLITPLEGKSAARKEDILRSQVKMGLPLPEGRTPSEKALIAKVRATAPSTAEIRVPSEKLREAKAAGFLTPLKGKSLDQKEKILRGLAMQGIPLPEAKTASEKKLIGKVRADVGLPPEPKTPSAKEKYNRAMAAGLITPLEAKSAARKEDILRHQTKMGLPLPEGRTPSEKALIAKVRATIPPEAGIRVPSEKLRKATAAGLLTPLEDKKPEHKEKILRGLAMQGIPLPEAKTASGKKLIDKVRADVGLPPEPKTSSIKEKYNRALAAGLITPLEGKSAARKEDILRGQTKMGLPLPEGRTPSEKALIAKVRATAPSTAEIRVPSEKLRKAKATGFLTPLKGKSLDQKEKILRGLAMQGIPLPEAKTASEKKLIDKVRGDVGLPPEPKTSSVKEKYNRAFAAGLVTPLEGKSAARKEDILRGQAKMGLPLPEGRTSSEKALIAKVKATSPLEPKFLPTEKPVVTGRPALAPKKLKKLDKRTAKIIKEIKGPSDECICDLLTPETDREIVGISVSKPPLKSIIPADKIPSGKLRKAKAEALLTSLEGKKPEEKERILKELALEGIPLPEAKSASEKKIIDKVRTEVGLPPVPKEPVAKKKFDKALADGIITPLEGKSAARKKEILRSQAKRGLILPQGRTPSEKAIIAKLKATVSPEKEIISKTDYGQPIKATTSSEKELVKAAKADGLLTPLKGKTSMQKEKILRGLADAGLPLPEGSTPSEKALVEKVRTIAGLPLEPTPSEKKGRIKKKTKKVGIDSTRKSAKGVGVAKSKGGIVEEFQDIIKTTTCDRGCGCDKKKIRFKHSYVKIRVTSPDISSLCPCPEECIPGIKGGVFTDNDGIKVTIGRITDIPLFTPRKLHKILRKIKVSGNISDPHCTVSSRNFLNDDIDYYSSSYIYSSDNISKNANFSLNSLQLNTNGLANSRLSNNIIFIKPFGDHFENSRTSSRISQRKFYSSDTSITSNLESVELLKTDSSISLITSSSFSIISFSLTETSSYSEDYMQEILCPNEYYKMKEQNRCSSYFNPKGLVFGIGNYNSTTPYKSSEILTSSKEKYDRDFIILQTGASEANKFQFLHTPIRYWPGMFVNCSNAENLETVYRLLLKSISKDSSSLVIMMPTSSEECDKGNSLESLNSNDDPQVTENHSNMIYKLTGLHNSYQNNKAFTLATRGKLLGKDLTLVEVFNRSKNENGYYAKQENCSKYCQIRQNIQKYQIISTDTTQDRPCCCPRKENDTKYKRIENYISETVTPMILSEAVPQGRSHETYINLNENKSLSRMTSNQLHLYNHQTPIRLCKAPPCSRHTGHRQPLSIPKDDLIKDVNLMKPCSCSINRRHFIERNATEMRSIACGKSEEDLRGKLAKLLRTAVKVPCKPVNSAKRSCITCVPPQGDESFSCLCKGKIRKMKGNNICPCEQDKIQSQTDVIKLLGSDKYEAFSSVGCQCKDRGNYKKKNVKCECPEQLEPEFVFDIRDWIDEAQIRKMKSDLTQTVSGFKLNIPRKTPESEKSFEDILKHFAENTEYDSEAYSCAEKSQSKYVSVECECPYEAPQPDKESLLPEETFQGIKFHIGGKGSDSKGLNGILCFELLHELLLSNSNATP